MPRRLINVRDAKPLLDVAPYARRGPGRRDHLAQAEIELIERTVRRAPEVMVKVLSRSGRDLRAVGPSGKPEFLSLRLFNPRSHQWSLNFASSNTGVLSTPMVGEFNNGRGEFYDQESVNGRMT